MPLTSYDASTGSALHDVDAQVAHHDIAVAEHFAHLDLAQVVPSLTNPRSHYDAEKLQQLADSITASGVHQPILVRPLPASRVPDTAHLTPRPTHEIVSGERRYRASRMAGQTTIPAMVRELTDAQVLEIQLVENLQRDDLTPLEEAHGYARLAAETSISKEDIGARIGKSRGYVYGRIKLLDLCAEGQKALREGSLEASVALLIARVPDHALQLKALKYATQKDWAGKERIHSYADVKEWIGEELMRPLGKARFPITQVDLVPMAGSCKACPKRTGAEPDLFADVRGADVCTDPTCYRAKEEAHSAVMVRQAKEKGQTVIAGKEAQELVTGGYKSKYKGYRRLDVAEDSPTDQPLRKIIGAQMKAEGITPVMIEHHQKKGELVAALPNDVVLRLLKAVEGQAQASKAVAKEARAFAEEKKAKAEAKAMERYEQEWRDQLLARTWARLQKGDVAAFTLDVHRHFALQAVANLSAGDADAMCKLLDLGKVAAHQALREFAKTTTSPDYLQLLVLMQRDVDRNAFTYRGPGNERINNEGLMLVAGIVHGDGLAKAISELQADAMHKHLPKPEPVAPATAAKPATARYVGPNGETWSGRGLKPKWVQVLLEQGRTLEEFDTSLPASGDGLAAQAAAIEKAKAQRAKPAAQARATPAPKRKMSAQEAMQGIADAMQNIEASAPADAGAPAAADDPGAELVQRATDLVIREQKASVRLLKSALNIGTATALQVMAALEQAGTVSACDERGARTVLAVRRSA